MPERSKSSDQSTSSLRKLLGKIIREQTNIQHAAKNKSWRNLRVLLLRQSRKRSVSWPYSENHTPSIFRFQVSSSSDSISFAPHHLNPMNTMNNLAECYAISSVFAIARKYVCTKKRQPFLESVANIWKNLHAWTCSKSTMGQISQCPVYNLGCSFLRFALSLVLMVFETVHSLIWVSAANAQGENDKEDEITAGEGK